MKDFKPTVSDMGEYSYLGSSQSVVLTFDTSEITADRDMAGKKTKPRNCHGRQIEFMPRGANDDMPLDIIRHSLKNVTIATNLDFKTSLAYGEGVQVLRRLRKEDGSIETREVLPKEEPQVFSWLRDNDYDRLIIELISDLRLFGDAYVEYVFDKDTMGHRVAQVRALEACCSRISKMNDRGEIEWHGYCDRWDTNYLTETIATPLLSRQFPLYDLKQRMGIYPDRDGSKHVGKDRRFVQMLSLPSPGRFYYSHPYWWSVFLSGWYDFSNTVITFKKALIHNEMVARHVVYIREDFWTRLYKEKAADSQEKKKLVKQEFLESLDKFLSGAENAGTSIVSQFQYDPMKAVEMKDILIEDIDKDRKGGDYIEDSEESSNVLCYGMGVHSSILGNSPGKSKTINGTEARELFVIQQALSKYVQKLCCQPLYMVRDMNGWPEDLDFAIANLQLTTLDKNTGAVKQTGISPESDNKKQKDTKK